MTTLAGGAEKLEWFQSPVLFLPGQVKAWSASLAEQDTIFQAPLVWALAGRLGSDVTIAGPGEPVTLKAGDILPRVNLRIGAGIDQRDRASLSGLDDALGQRIELGALAGELDHQTVGIIEFPDLAAIKTWHGSDAYQALIPLRSERTREPIYGRVVDRRRVEISDTPPSPQATAHRDQASGVAREALRGPGAAVEPQEQATKLQGVHER